MACGCGRAGVSRGAGRREEHDGLGCRWRQIVRTSSEGHQTTSSEGHQTILKKSFAGQRS